MRLKKLFSILFLSGVILGTVFCAGCGGSDDSSDRKERTEKSDRSDKDEDDEDEDDEDEDDDDEKDSDKDNEKDDKKDDKKDSDKDDEKDNEKDDKKDNDKKDDKKEDDSKDQKDNVTVDDLVDAYLAVSYNEIDYSATDTTEFQMSYGEDYDNLEAYMSQVLQISYDADTGILYETGTMDISYSPNSFGLEDESVQSEIYRLYTDDSTYIEYELDPEDGYWYESEYEDDSSKEDEAEIMSTGKIAEKNGKYVLTVNCSASDIGLELEELTGVPGDCDVQITVTFDNANLQCTSFLAEFDVSDINRYLSSDEGQFDKMVIKRENIKYKNVNLSLPSDFE